MRTVHIQRRQAYHPHSADKISILRIYNRSEKSTKDKSSRIFEALSAISTSREILKTRSELLKIAKVFPETAECGKVDISTGIKFLLRGYVIHCTSVNTSTLVI